MSNIVKINVDVLVPSSALIADASLLDLLQLERLQNRQLKAQELALEELRSEIKGRIGDYTKVVGGDGEIAATYDWTKGAESVDRDALRAHFADVYEIVKKIGESKRRLIVK